MLSKIALILSLVFVATFAAKYEEEDNVLVLTE